MIRGSEGMAVQFASCCRPIPGDPIIGFIKKGQGLVVHTHDCPTALKSRTDPDKWIDVEWAPDTDRIFDVAIRVVAANQRGVLAKVAAAIAEAGSNIDNVSMDEERGIYTAHALHHPGAEPTAPRPGDEDPAPHSGGGPDHAAARPDGAVSPRQRLLRRRRYMQWRKDERHRASTTPSKATGPWLAMSHSLACNSRMWDEQVPLLTKRFKVLRFDTRGHGASDAPAGDVHARHARRRREGPVRRTRHPGGALGRACRWAG